MNLSACLVTRGDVEMVEITNSLMEAGISDIIIYDNSGPQIVKVGPNSDLWECIPTEVDLAVYGRYAAIEYATHNLIYTQDDDCVLTVEAIERLFWESDSAAAEYGRLVCNMPEPFRHTYYQKHALVGFGAVFHRSLPTQAWGKFTAKHGDAGFPTDYAHGDFLHTCDVVFTALTPYTTVDVPYRNLSWATASNRMYHQPNHVRDRLKMLDLALKAIP